MLEYQKLLEEKKELVALSEWEEIQELAPRYFHVAGREGVSFAMAAKLWKGITKRSISSELD